MPAVQETIDAVADIDDDVASEGPNHFSKTGVYDLRDLTEDLSQESSCEYAPMQTDRPAESMHSYSECET